MPDPTPVVLTRLKKHKTMIFLNTGTSSSKVWSRIGRSTIFDLAMNANTEDSDFIQDEMPTTDVTYYKPTLPEELQCVEGDPAFDALYEMFQTRPTGEDVKKEVLLIFAGASSPYVAWDTESTIILKNFNTVDEKILFDININKITDGTATVASGVPTFTANQA